MTKTLECTNPTLVSTKEMVNILHAKAKGTFFTVGFTKRTNNEYRQMNCRLGVQKGLKGTKKNKRNTGLLTVYDMTKKAYRNINLSGLRWVKLRGETYLVTG